MAGMSLLLCLFLGATHAPHSPHAASDLEGAWKMVLNRNQSMDDLGLEMVKVLVDGHFIFAFFNSETQQFYSTGGGEYTYENGVYTEIIRFHTIDPTLVGRSLPFDAKIEGNRWYHGGELDGTEMNEVYEKINGVSALDLMGAWEMSASGSSDSDMDAVKKKQAQTWKLVIGDRYAWATFSPKKGTLLDCGGGNISMQDNWCREKVDYRMTDSLMVGKTLAYQGEPENGEWKVKMPVTRGTDAGQMVVWSRMK